MMKLRAKIDDNQVDKLNLTISITMTVAEWRAIMKQLPEAWPGWKLSKEIAGALGHVSRATDATFDVD